MLISRPITEEILKIIFLTVLAGSITIGCTRQEYNEATYFRQFQTSQSDERVAWGLCGGSFYKGGQVKPDFSPKLMECMRQKGFLTINEYYEENFMDFIDERKPGRLFMTIDISQQCGFRRYGKGDGNRAGGLCEGSLYLRQADVPRVAARLKNLGFSPILPRYKLGIRVYENKESIPRDFCYTMRPKNKKGGFSWGTKRFLN